MKNDLMKMAHKIDRIFVKNGTCDPFGKWVSLLPEKTETDKRRKRRFKNAKVVLAGVDWPEDWPEMPGAAIAVVMFKKPKRGERSESQAILDKNWEVGNAISNQR